MKVSKAPRRTAIALATLRESAGKAANTYTDKHVGPRERIGNKG